MWIRGKGKRPQRTAAPWNRPRWAQPEGSMQAADSAGWLRPNCGCARCEDLARSGNRLVLRDERTTGASHALSSFATPAYFSEENFFRTACSDDFSALCSKVHISFAHARSDSSLLCVARMRLAGHAGLF